VFPLFSQETILSKPQNVGRLSAVPRFFFGSCVAFCSPCGYNDKIGVIKTFLACSIDQIDLVVVPKDIPENIEKLLIEHHVDIIKSK
jgi:hypothetical protein